MPEPKRNESGHLPPAEGRSGSNTARVSTSKRDKAVPAEDFTVRPPSIALPNGGGAIRGMGEKFAANPVTGTASLSIPIATSPGRGGFDPELSLVYDSGNGNGPFGWGWSLPQPFITRLTDKGLPQYRDAVESDVYVLAGAEELVPVLDDDGDIIPDDEETAPGFAIRRYRPRIEGLFARIERWTQRTTGAIHFRVIGRDNVTSLYGRTSESRIFDPADVAPEHCRDRARARGHPRSRRATPRSSTGSCTPGRAATSTTSSSCSRPTR